MIGVEDDILDNYIKDMLKEEETLKNFIDKVTEDKILDAIKNSVKVDEKAISIEAFNKMFE